MKEERRAWGHWKLETSGIKTLAYYPDGKNQSIYGLPIHDLDDKEVRDNWIEQAKKSWTTKQDNLDLITAINELIRDKTVLKETKRFNKNN